MRFPKILFLVTFIAGITACQSGEHPHQHGKKHQHNHQKQGHGQGQGHGHQHKHQHGHGHQHGDANAHMNSSSFEELVARFESPERDAYQQPEKVLDYLGEVKGEKILDIGAGTGYFAFRLAERGAKVIAGDVDDRFQQYIQDKMDKEDAAAVELRKLPYDSPALEENEVNRVLIVNTYHHIENRSEYFAKVLNGLKDGGELIVIDFIKKEDGPGPPIEMKMAAEVVVNELQQAGFTEFDTNKTLLPHQYIIRAKG